MVLVINYMNWPFACRFIDFELQIVSVLNSDFRQTFRKVSNAKMFDLITNFSLLIHERECQNNALFNMLYQH